MTLVNQTGAGRVYVRPVHRHMLTRAAALCREGANRQQNQTGQPYRW